VSERSERSERTLRKTVTSTKELTFIPINFVWLIWLAWLDGKNKNKNQKKEYANFDYSPDGDDEDEGGKPQMGNNVVITTDGRATEGGKEIMEWQKAGVDLGTTVREWRGEEDEALIMDLAREYLGMQ